MITHIFFLSMTSTHKFRRLLSIFRVTSVPQKFSWEWWNTTRVVYCWYHWCGDLYIGSTEHSVFDRKQSRIRKHRKLQANQVAFYEPALKLWHRQQNPFEICIFLVWIHPNDGTTLVTMEQLFQQTFRPVYNWPWINPVLKKWKIGKQLFGPKLTAPDCIPGRKMVRKYRKGHRGQLRCSLGQQLDNNIIFCMRWDLTPDRSLIVLSSYAPIKLTLNMSFFYTDYLAISVNHIDLEHNTVIQPWGSGASQAIPFDLGC
jgi:hypothetical protein